jgi:hypothetical protein
MKDAGMSRDTVEMDVDVVITNGFALVPEAVFSRVLLKCSFQLAST